MTVCVLRERCCLDFLCDIGLIKPFAVPEILASCQLRRVLLWKLPPVHTFEIGKTILWVSRCFLSITLFNCEILWTTDPIKDRILQYLFIQGKLSYYILYQQTILRNIRKNILRIMPSSKLFKSKLEFIRWHYCSVYAVSNIFICLIIHTLNYLV